MHHLRRRYLAEGLRNGPSRRVLLHSQVEQLGLRGRAERLRRPLRLLTEHRHRRRRRRGRRRIRNEDLLQEVVVLGGEQPRKFPHLPLRLRLVGHVVGVGLARAEASRQHEHHEEDLHFQFLNRSSEASETWSSSDSRVQTSGVTGDRKRVQRNVAA